MPTSSTCAGGGDEDGEAKAPPAHCMGLRMIPGSLSIPSSITLCCECGETPRASPVIAEEKGPLRKPTGLFLVEQQLWYQEQSRSLRLTEMWLHRAHRAHRSKQARTAADHVLVAANGRPKLPLKPALQSPRSSSTVSPQCPRE